MRTWAARLGCEIRRLVASGALGALLVTGCGGDGPPTASVTPLDGSGAIVVVTRDGSFSVERIEVQANTTTTMALENQDAVGHTLTVYLASSPEGDVAADTGEVSAGQRGEAVIFFSAPGEHAFRCEIHPDRMRGTLVVR